MLASVAEGLGLAIEEEDDTIASEGDGSGNGDDGEEPQELVSRREDVGRRLSQDRERRRRIADAAELRPLPPG